MREIVAWMHSLVTGDATMQSIVGGTVFLDWLWGDADEVFPYMVHSYAASKTSDRIVLAGDWFFDLYDHDPNDQTMDRIFLMRNRLVALVDQQKPGVDGTAAIASFTGVRFWCGAEVPTPIRQNDVWHLRQTFEFRACPARDIQAVVTRVTA